MGIRNIFATSEGDRKEQLKQSLNEIAFKYVNPVDVLRKSLELFSAFYKADMSIIIINGVNVCLLESTVVNPDNKKYIINLFKEAIEKNVDISTYRFQNRMGIRTTKNIPLLIGNYIFGYLLVEKNEDNHYDYIDDLPIFTTLTQAIRIYCLERDKSINIHKDPQTKLKMRDSLILDLNNIVRNTTTLENEHLAMIYLSNIEQLNADKGIEQTDILISKIGKKLSERNLQAYRVGGARFAVIIHKDCIDSKTQVEELLDVINQIDDAIIVSLILTPLKENIYDSLYICEKNIKVVDEDVVTIIRDDPSREEWENLVKTYNMYSPKDSQIEDVKVIDVESVEYLNDKDAVLNNENTKEAMLCNADKESLETLSNTCPNKIDEKNELIDFLSNIPTPVKPVKSQKKQKRTKKDVVPQDADEFDFLSFNFGLE